MGVRVLYLLQLAIIALCVKYWRLAMQPDQVSLMGMRRRELKSLFALNLPSLRLV